MSAPAASLTQYADPARPTGLVLLLHGGKDRGETVVDDRSASWRRSAAMARALAGDLEAAGAAGWLLRYRHRGWNGGTGPVEDARWALDQARAELGDLPIALLGHSMGARTAVHVADHPRVRGVVALAPWLPPDEPVAALAGKRLVAAHGSHDHITSPGDQGVRRARAPRRRRGDVRRHGPGRPLHAPPDLRLERGRPLPHPRPPHLTAESALGDPDLVPSRRLVTRRRRRVGAW